MSYTLQGITDSGDAAVAIRFIERWRADDKNLTQPPGKRHACVFERVDDRIKVLVWHNGVTWHAEVRKQEGR